MVGESEVVLRQALVAVLAEANALDVDLDVLLERVRTGLLGYDFYRTVPTAYVDSALRELTLAFRAFLLMRGS